MDATLRAEPGSEMAHLFGTATPTPIGGLANRFQHAEGRLVVADSSTAADCKKDEQSCDERDVNDNNDDRSNAGDPVSTVQDTVDNILHGDEEEDAEDADDDDHDNAGKPINTVQDAVDDILHGDED